MSYESPDDGTYGDVVLGSVFLLSRQFHVKEYEVDRDHNPTGKIEEWTETKVIGGYDDLDAVNAAIEAECVVTEGASRPPRVITPLNRFAIYESTGDVDRDGFPDGYAFLKVRNATAPEPEGVTIRTGRRRK